MNRVEPVHPNDPIYRRIDEMHLSAGQAAGAKASFRSAEAIIDFGFAAVAAIRSAALSLIRHLKSRSVISAQR